MDAIEKGALAQLAQLLQAGGCEGELRIGREFGKALVAEIAALTPHEGQHLSESDKDVALAQAVEFAEYVERQAKGAMVDAAKRFLSLPYAQELSKRLTPPEGHVPERSVLVAATRLRKLASAATPMARPAYIKAAELIELAVIAARPEVP